MRKLLLLVVGIVVGWGGTMTVLFILERCDVINIYMVNKNAVLSDMIDVEKVGHLSEKLSLSGFSAEVEKRALRDVSKSVLGGTMIFCFAEKMVKKEDKDVKLLSIECMHNFIQTILYPSMRLIIITLGMQDSQECIDKKVDLLCMFFCMDKQAVNKKIKTEGIEAVRKLFLAKIRCWRK